MLATHAVIMGLAFYLISDGHTHYPPPANTFLFGLTRGGRESFFLAATIAIGAA